MKYIFLVKYLFVQEVSDVFIVLYDVSEDWSIHFYDRK